MTIPPPDDFERRLFEGALDQPAGPVRDAWLKDACAGDAAMELRIHALLRAHEQESGFLPDALPTVATPPTEQPGQRIGRYKLLQQIGEGGFGTVWMAEQVEPVTRRVALKIIKLGMDTREVIARFEAERQALAMMDHPNIAKVLDAGSTDQGRPFFVMELVKGIPITQFCDEKQLGTRERLVLFADVCSAINHAHQKGVIHRDIKPSNVLVTLHGDKAVPKVIDFGIAKATQGKLTERTLFTRFEQFIGTPVYMSPEQAALSGLDIDTRSDIYALGILLYELLTGKPPFDAKSLASAGYEEMRRIIREVEPPKPSARLSTVVGDERTTLARARHIDPERLDRLVEPDLDWIVMKAIEKDRTRRYETANGLALDIQRFLADEPVSATPPSAGYRFRKFARRNRTALRVAAGVSVVLVAATAASTWQAVRATRAEQLATDRLDQVAAERDQKEAALQDAEAISTFLTKLFQSADPARDGRTITVAESLDRAARSLGTKLSSQPAVRAQLQWAVGETYSSLGLYTEAIAQLEKARDFCLEAHGPDEMVTIQVMIDLAHVYRLAGRDEESLRNAEALVERSKRVAGAEAPSTLDAADLLAIAYLRAGRLAEAIKLGEQTLETERKASGPRGERSLSPLSNLASTYFTAGRYVDSLRMREQALELARERLGPEHPTTLMALNNLAIEHTEMGRHEESIRMQELLLDLRRKVSGPEHPDTLMARHNLARGYAEAGRIDEALAMGEGTLDIHSKGHPAASPPVLYAMVSWASLLGLAGKEEKAMVIGEQAVDLARQIHDPTRNCLIQALGTLAELYEDSGRDIASIPVHEEALELLRSTKGAESPNTLAEMSNLARAYAEVDRAGDAIALEEKALEIKRRVLLPSHEWLGTAANNLGNLYVNSGRTAEGLKLIEESVELAVTNHGLEHWTTHQRMNNLAASYAEAGRLDDAIPLQEKALALSRKDQSTRNKSLRQALQNLALMYEHSNREAEARTLRDELGGLEAVGSAK